MDNNYVFISFSSKDRVFADNVLNYIENELQIPCWICYRNITTGFNYPEVIDSAINNCGCFLLLYSKDSFKSEHVKNELELAISYNKIVLPCKIDDTELAGTFNYYLHSKHWLDIAHTQQNSLEALSYSLSKIMDNHTALKVVGDDFIRIGTEVCDLFSCIANEGADEYLQPWINKCVELFETPDGKRNHKLYSSFCNIILEIKYLQKQDCPDFSKLVDYMNVMWNMLKTLIY